MNQHYGSSLKGYLNGIRFDHMIQVFGEPTFYPEDSGDGKVNYEWLFIYKSKVFTVYDWKVSKEYTENFLGLEFCGNFHVGGKTDVTDFINFIEEKVDQEVGILS